MRRRKVKRRRKYAAKAAIKGADRYGVWRDDKCISPEHIAGKVIYP